MEKIVIGMGAGTITNWIRDFQNISMKTNQLKNLLKEYSADVKLNMI